MKKIITLGILLAISIGINVWFISGKGIIVNQDRRVINNNNNSQWQGQMLINQFMVQGDKIEWKIIEADLNEITVELNKLHPISSLYSKVFYPMTKREGLYFIIYPDIFHSKK
jgi:hypothetical protein